VELHCCLGLMACAARPVCISGVAVMVSLLLLLLMSGVASKVLGQSGRYSRCLAALCKPDWQTGCVVFNYIVFKRMQYINLLLHAGCVHCSSSLRANVLDVHSCRCGCIVVAASVHLQGAAVLVTGAFYLQPCVCYSSVLWCYSTMLSGAAAQTAVHYCLQGKVCARELLQALGCACIFWRQ
jgi:hypothetical protein